MEIVSSRNTGEWQIVIGVEKNEDDNLVWVDLNNNGTRDADEGIGLWDWATYRRPRTTNNLKIYGPVTKLSCSFNNIKDIHLQNNNVIKELECTYTEELTSVDFSTNKSLKKLSIYGCKLEAPAMQSIVDGLADRSGMQNAGVLFVLNSPDKPEVNEILKTTVIQAKGKNWNVKYFTGQEDYEGSDHSLYVTTLPKTTMTSSMTEGSEWAFVFNAGEENRKRLWIDLNGNDLYDYGEEQNIFDAQVRIPIKNKTISIYGDLDKLTCRGVSLTALNVSGMPNLKILDCSDNSLSELNLVSNTKLTDLLAYKNQIGSIDLSASTMLTNVSLNNNKLSQLSLAENKELAVLFVSDNGIENLDVSACTKLEAFAFGNNKIKNIDLSGNTNISTLYCNGNNLSVLDLSALTKLGLLSCENNAITSLILPESPQLSSVYCFGNRLEGEAMTALCKKLPVREADKKGSVFIIDTKNENEGNKCTDTDVQYAKKANWNVYDYRGKANGGYNPYEGMTTGVETLPETGEVVKISYFSSLGLEGNEPFKGMNVVVTQYKDGSVVKTKRVF
ncbi:leucine-rich repeat domain-containing protein [Prevotella sp. OH937_COT-195]|uniref:leucine-rich repeat domain-containing protein n=1 Tax=Prevotella sp. OH937_COT-195 TaxID=2491051 RepID=UPI001315517F|nr:hypothetical protein [Prevotella sp. OH937_COT-195]